jgi:hypothetical protein
MEHRVPDLANPFAARTHHVSSRLELLLLLLLLVSPRRGSALGSTVLDNENHTMHNCLPSMLPLSATNIYLLGSLNHRLPLPVPL